MNVVLRLLLLLSLGLVQPVFATDSRDTADYPNYIDAERLPSLIIRARAVAELLLADHVERVAEDELADIPEVCDPFDPAITDSITLRMDRSLKQAALSLLLLRNWLAESKLAPRAMLASVQWPNWIHEPPSATTPVKVLNQRLDWLQPLVTGVTDPICNQATAKTGDTLICSIE